MIGILSFLLGSRLGRMLAGGLLLAMMAGAFAAHFYLKGRRAEQARQAARSLNNLRKRIKTDDAIARMSRADRRRALSEWMR